jgi:hypothetical protein
MNERLMVSSGERVAGRVVPAVAEITPHRSGQMATESMETIVCADLRASWTYGARRSFSEVARSAEWRGLTVAVEGCGNVGRDLARLLRDAGAGLGVADIDREWALRLAGNRRLHGTEDREKHPRHRAGGVLVTGTAIPSPQAAALAVGHLAGAVAAGLAAPGALVRVAQEGTDGPGRLHGLRERGGHAEPDRRQDAEGEKHLTNRTDHLAHLDLLADG